MNFLFWKKKSEPKVMNSKELFDELILGLEAKSGVPVTWQTALQCVTSLACAVVKANGLAQVPFRLFRSTSGVRLPATDHPLYMLLAHAPNDFQSSFEFRQEVGLHLCLTGNAFIWSPKLNGRVVELLPYPPGSVMVTGDGWEKQYHVSTTNGFVEIPREEMWHIRWLPWEGTQGLDGVRLAREAIGLSLVTEQHGALLFRNSAQPRGLLSTDKILTEEQRKALKAAWHQAHGGENKFGTAVMYGGMTFSALGFPNDQSQFLETRRFQVEEVCRAFGVLPIMVGHNDKASTYASAEQMFLHHAVHCLGPWYANFESSATRWLLTPKELKDGYYCKLNANGLMRGSAKDRAEYFAKALGAGGAPAWMTQDEIRELEELNPKGGNAALLREPTNVGGKPDKSGKDMEG